jgi:hypothetical protein
LIIIHRRNTFLMLRVFVCPYLNQLPCLWIWNIRVWIESCVVVYFLRKVRLSLWNEKRIGPPIMWSHSFTISNIALMEVRRKRVLCL